MSTYVRLRKRKMIRRKEEAESELAFERRRAVNQLLIVAIRNSQFHHFTSFTLFHTVG